MGLISNGSTVFDAGSMSAGFGGAMTFIKKLNATAAIGVWHQGFNNGDYDSFGELLSDTSWYSNQGVNGHFSAAPGTDFLTLTAYGQVNTSSDSYVGYFWANVEGMQKFGYYEGNGNADGPFIYTGFRPRLLVVKRTSSSGGWRVYDTARHTFNPNDAIVRWNDDGYEDTANQPIDFLSNGFKIRSSNQYLNQSGGDFIYMAWGDVPFKYNNTF